MNKSRAYDNPAPHHDGGTSGVLRQRHKSDTRLRTVISSDSTMELTNPYKNREGMPVMTLMIEKDTPKF